MDPRAWLSGSSGTAPTAPGSPSVGYPTGGNPLTNTPPTNPGPYWFYQLAEELRAVIVAGGLTPAQGTLNQLLLAIQAISGAVLYTAAIPDGFKVGPLMVQFTSQAVANVPAGIPGATGTITFPHAFPTACLVCFASMEVSAPGSPANFTATITSRSTTQCTFDVEEWSAIVNPGIINVLAIGW